MLATLTFNLPDEKQEFNSATQGEKYASALWDIKQLIRGVVKHGTEDDLETTLEKIRELIPTDEELYL